MMKKQRTVRSGSWRVVQPETAAARTFAAQARDDLLGQHADLGMLVVQQRKHGLETGLVGKAELLIIYERSAQVSTSEQPLRSRGAVVRLRAYRESRPC